MDPKIVKKTQDTLGKIIKKPPLTEKLLGKPPFRFLHDIMTSVIKTTGFMQGLFTEVELNSENVKDKDSKIMFLQKVIDMVSLVTSKELSVKPAKIVAGHEPEKTNEFLQALADAINKNVDNDEFVKRVLKGAKGGASSKDERKEDKKEKVKSEEKKKTRETEVERGKTEQEASREHADEEGERKREKDKERDRHREKKHDRDREKDRHRDKRHDKDMEKESGEKKQDKEGDRDRRRDRDRESKTRDKSKETQDDRHRDRDKEKAKKLTSPDQNKKPGLQSASSKPSRLSLQASDLSSLPKKELHKGKRYSDSQAARLQEPSPGRNIDDSTPKMRRLSGNNMDRDDMNLMATEDEMDKDSLSLLGQGGAASSSVKEGSSSREQSLTSSTVLERGAASSLTLEQRENLATGDHWNVALQREQSRDKENESPDREKLTGNTEEKQEPSTRLQRPASAKGSRRRRGDEEEAPKRKESMIGEGDLPPQVIAARQLARPSSARPAPPRPKQDTLESEPAMRLGTGQPTNVIGDNDDDDDDNFLVQETVPPPPDPDLTQIKHTEGVDTQHGALVQKMLESKKEVERGGPGKKTEIERPLISDAQRRKQREAVQKEVDKLRSTIQSLTRSANPLGKVMDYVQEDMDSMQQELDKWRAENAQHALDLKREMNVTDRAVDPLRQQLTDLDRAVADQLDQIAAVKCNIIKNDLKIQKVLRGISGS